MARIEELLNSRIATVSGGKSNEMKLRWFLVRKVRDKISDASEASASVITAFPAGNP